MLSIIFATRRDYTGLIITDNHGFTKSGLDPFGFLKVHGGGSGMLGIFRWEPLGWIFMKYKSHRGISYAKYNISLNTWELERLSCKGFSAFSLRSHVWDGGELGGHLLSRPKRNLYWSNSGLHIIFPITKLLGKSLLFLTDIRLERLTFLKKSTCHWQWNNPLGQGALFFPFIHLRRKRSWTFIDHKRCWEWRMRDPAREVWLNRSGTSYIVILTSLLPLLHHLRYQVTIGTHYPTSESIRKNCQRHCKKLIGAE